LADISAGAASLPQPDDIVDRRSPLGMMFLDSKQLLERASEARKIADGLSIQRDADILLAYACKCEMAALLARLGQLQFEDLPVPPHGPFACDTSR
jgi:hypothetical protein